jgi:hypothetical protein
MSEPKQPWLKFEAIKTSMRQDGKGTYMTLTIHPDEVPVDLLAARPGTRYMVGMLPLDDHDQPVKGKDMDEGERAVQSAGMLCRNIKFQRWMEKQGYSMDISEDGCAEGLKIYCEIGSRAELKGNKTARRLFIELRERFENEVF